VHLQALAHIATMPGAEPNSAEAQRDLAGAWFPVGAFESTAGRFRDVIGNAAAD